MSSRDDDARVEVGERAAANRAARAISGVTRHARVIAPVVGVLRVPEVAAIELPVVVRRAGLHGFGVLLGILPVLRVLTDRRVLGGILGRWGVGTGRKGGLGPNVLGLALFLTLAGVLALGRGLRRLGLGGGGGVLLLLRVKGLFRGRSRGLGTLRLRLLPQLVTPAARAGLGLLLLLLVMLLLLLLVLLLLQAALASQSLSDAASRVRVFHGVAHTAGAANLGNVDEDLDAADSSNRWGRSPDGLLRPGGRVDRHVPRAGKHQSAFPNTRCDVQDAAEIAEVAVQVASGEPRVGTIHPSHGHSLRGRPVLRPADERHNSAVTHVQAGGCRLVGLLRQAKRQGVLEGGRKHVQRHQLMSKLGISGGDDVTSLGQNLRVLKGGEDHVLIVDLGGGRMTEAQSSTRW